jgi:hypothetical protein
MPDRRERDALQAVIVALNELLWALQRLPADHPASGGIDEAALAVRVALDELRGTVEGG